jgi:hypothetical protein
LEELVDIYNSKDSIVPERFNQLKDKIESELAELSKEVEPVVKSAEEILDKHSVHYGSCEGNPRTLIYVSEALEAMEEYAAIVEKRSCEICAMFWNKNASTQHPTRERIIEVLNKYSTTNIGWIEEAHGERTLLIDPMDYHKIADELTKSE